MCMIGAEITEVHRNVEYQTRLFETQCYDFQSCGGSMVAAEASKCPRAWWFIESFKDRWVMLGNETIVGLEAIIHVQDQALNLLCRSMFHPFHDEYLL